MADIRLLPAGIRDERSEALLTLLDRLEDLDLTKLLVYRIDEIDASALPSMAWQFHVTGGEGWDVARTEEQRRGLILKALEVHRFKGTPWAIRNALAAVGLDARIVEWFEEGGDPYTFRVDVAVTDRGVDETAYESAERLIQATKNTRSHLTSIRLVGQVRGHLHLAAATFAGDVVTVEPWSLAEAEAGPGAVHVAAAAFIHADTVSVYPGAS